MIPLMQITNLSGGYGRESIIKEISLENKAGDFMGIIGPNGCGKTTLLRLLTRVLVAQSGSVSLEGKNIAAMNLKAFCQKVAFVPQDTNVNFPFRVLEIVLMGRIPHLHRLQQEGAADIKIAEESLAMTDTATLKDTLIDELSSGERQRVIIAKALTQSPRLLFLDEPTSHLDIGHQIQILDLLRKLNRTQKLTIVTVLHDLNLASEYCNRIVLLEKGRLFKEGRPEQVLTYETIEAVYKTVVVVKENPISKKPYVILISGDTR
jgi:iron complex transport system ATP-binding protein